MVNSLPGATLAFDVALAAALWIVVFAWHPLPFWWLMLPAMAVLGALGAYRRTRLPRSASTSQHRPHGTVADAARDALIGVATAILLYAFFAAGHALLSRLPGFAGGVTTVYRMTRLPKWLMAGLLLFVAGPAESVFWQGYVLETGLRRWSPGAAWAASVVPYALVHCASGNPALVAAALAGGAFWSYLYLRMRRLLPVIVSHAIWDLIMLVILPLR
ncbi:MAG: CPBP family intramembrane metalloprotease [Firmicutes bacterium]|nr:CPBP family intramembrane metalloprotease [Bacillota bacterium]